jgi:hypothetical protein
VPARGAMKNVMQSEGPMVFGSLSLLVIVAVTIPPNSRCASIKVNRPLPATVSLSASTALDSPESACALARPTAMNV